MEVKWEAQVENAFFLPSADLILRIVNKMNTKETMMIKREKNILNPASVNNNSFLIYL